MSLTLLAEKILANAKELDKRGVVDIDSKLGFRDMRPNDLRARADLISAIHELERLAYGPMESVWAWGWVGTLQMIGLQAVARYNIPSNVPDEGISLTALAAKVGMDEQHLARLVRNGIVFGMFKETEPGFITHTPTSKLLKVDEDWLDAAKWMTEENWPCAARTLDAIEKWPGTHKPTETAFNLFDNTTEPLFEHLSKQPKRLKTISGYFRAIATLPSQRPDSLSQSPFWKGVDTPGTTVVDIGGNRGDVSMQLAQATEHIRFVVEDLPDTVKLGEERLPKEFSGRITFKPHDFFQEQPVKGADVYFLRKIMHDWSDPVCVQILRNVIPALQPGARVVVCDRILPDQASPGYEERDGRCSDLLMLMALNGRERTVSEWKSLFAEVDHRFELQLERWESTNHGLIIATWKP